MGIEEIDNQIEKIVKDLNDGTNEKHSKKVNAFSSFMLDIQLKGFKKNGTNAFSLSERLEVEFLPYIYEVKNRGEQVAKFLYSKQINSDEAKEMVSNAIKSTFADIKRRVKQ